MTPDFQDLHDAWEQAQPVTYASTAYLVHSTIWRQRVDPVIVYTTRQEAQAGMAALVAFGNQHHGYCITPFCHDGALGEEVTLTMTFNAYGKPYTNVQVAEAGIVVPVFQSELPY
jgi:hypothetical protein